MFEIHIRFDGKFWKLTRANLSGEKENTLYLLDKGGEGNWRRCSTTRPGKPGARAALGVWGTGTHRLAGLDDSKPTVFCGQWWSQIPQKRV